MWITLAWTFIRSFFSGDKLGRGFSFVAVHWKEFALATVIGLFLYQMFSPYQFLLGLDTVPSLNKEIAKLEKKLEEAEANFEVCKAGNQVLEAAIDDQNSQIRQWGDLAKKIDKSTDELKTKIDKSRLQSKKDVESILRDDPTPQTCGEAMDYLRKSMEELKWKSSR
jgi:septal ring factor EnvC (AmiA/AmiB activator)